MKTTAIIAALLVAALSAAVAQQGDDLAIRKVNATTLRIEFRPRFHMQQVRGSRGEVFTIPAFAGAIIPDGEPGSPVIPYRALPVSLRGAGYSVRILEVASHTMSDVSPAPFPTHRPDGSMGVISEYAAGTIGPRESAGRISAELTDVGPAREGLQGTLKLTPVEFDAATKTLRVCDRMVVQIDLGSAPSAARRQTGGVADSPLSTGEWYSIDVRETGIYKLDQSFFVNSNIPLTAVSNINSIRVFGNGGQMLPENLATPRPGDLQEIARLVVDLNNNGAFDPGDYVLFYGRSPRGWTYTPATRSFSHFINYYSETNKYFVTFGGGPGRQMDSLVSFTDPAPFQPADFQGRLFVEEERNNLLNSGRQWVGQLFDSESRTGVYTNLLPGYVATKPAVYRFVLLSRSPRAETFRVQENGEDLGGPVTTFGVDVASIEKIYAAVTPVVTVSRTGPLAGDRSVLRFTFEPSDQSAQGWLDWFEIQYRRRFEAVSDLLAFTSPDTDAVVQYNLENFSSRSVLVFDVTDHANVRRIAGLAIDPLDPSKCSFQLPQTSGSVRELMAVGPNGFKTPDPAVHVSNSNLHGIASGADVVIVTPTAFKSEADRLKQYRESHDSLSCLVVTEDDVMNEYSGGLTDPLAVRDFLYDAWTRWTNPPRYVLLFGSGHYDYKHIRTNAPNWIPPYESLESILQIQTFASDDFLGMLNPGNPRVSVRLGRLPVRTLDEARAMVDKIIGYETAAPFDPWRNRVTFVADDGLTSTGDDGNTHTYQAETLAEYYTPASFEKKKIYIVEFPTVNSSSGRRKPTANAAIIDAMNTGSLVVNYTGHGNPQLWAHEAVFTREGSIPQLTNRDRLFFLVAATCDFARYDNPAEESAGEQILTMGTGGAIGVITSSRAVYSLDNSLFNNSLYTALFSRDSLQKPLRLGDVMYATKQTHYSTNDLKYHLFGDPTMRLNFPDGTAGVDSINGSAIVGMTQIKTLSRPRIAGEIRRPDGTRWTGFSGKGVLEVFDSQRKVLVPEWQNFSFVVQGALLYRGLVSVTDGEFQALVPIPKDVSYANDHARISLYAWTNSTDAVGYSENVMIAGTDSTAVADTTGPEIEIYMDDTSFRSGDVVRPDPLLIVKLYDENGINTSTSSVGHGMEATLSSSQQPIDLTGAYQGDIDTYQHGEVRYPLRNLPDGHQTLTVKAWDIYNNSSEAQVVLDVEQQSDLAMYHVLNFPNPVARSTVFTFQRNSAEPIDVVVKIYTVAGRRIEEVKAFSVIDRFVQIPWDGRDANGDPLANGVYLYKIIVRSLSGSGSREALGKLTMLR